MELAGFLYTLTSLTVIPNRSQLFQYESLSLSCEQNGKPSDWRVKAKTVRGVSECGGDWGSIQTSTCVITEAYQWNSGEYWCESQSGEMTPAVNITITGNNVILESPVLPVMEGESVTLRCTTQKNSSRLQTSTFMRDRTPLEATLTGRITLHAISRSDEGLYMCMISGAGASLESWISVRAPDALDAAATPGAPGDPPPLPLHRLCLLAVGTPYLLSSVILALIYRDRARAQRVKNTTACSKVLMEETQC